MIVDITLDNFNQVVLEGSFNKPVLIDFWADCCEPCKTLTPLLEKIVVSYQNELVLAKINCDVELEIVSQFGVRNLPTVILFKEGQPVDGFTGNQPESAIREMLDKHIAPPVIAEQDDFQQAEELYKQGRIEATEQLLKSLLTVNNNHMAGLILYARCLAQQGKFVEAETILDSVTGDEYKQAVATAKVQLTFLKQAKELPDVDVLQAKLVSNPNSEEISYHLAIVLLANQQYEQAMQQLLSLFKRNRQYQEGVARKTLVQLFELLGNDHPLVTDYRRKLYQALY